MATSSRQYTVTRGERYPLGAHCVDGGVNFALFSANAERVDLCLFDDEGRVEIARLPLVREGGEVWSGFVPGLKPGALYGYRVHGPWDPAAGHRFNAHKLLVDPYARQLSGNYQVRAEDHAFSGNGQDGQPTIDTRDNGATMVKCVVTGPDQGGCKPVRHRGSLIYELNVRGYTMRMDGIDDPLRGTFSGLSQPAVIDYLRATGISCIELMPAHYFLDEQHLVELGLRNYWGYNSLNFFAPANRYMAGTDRHEFREMVARFRDAGISVLLDVVYNHTAEGDHRGPSLSFRGIDNVAYYRLDPQDKSRYINDTGCGNTLNMSHHRTLQLVMDSLRYWVTEMGVSGFRFDLATTLGREPHGFEPEGRFLSCVQQDPVLANARLIAEPWDVGPGGYQMGRFPLGWSEWNDHYRDTVRRFWRGDAGQLPALASCLHGSSERFEHNRRTSRASINFIASHDGFTLNDLVSYCERHNLANGEGNRDGHHANYSANHGVEGPTRDVEVIAWRERHKRNLLATLMLSQGVPMLLAGDEFGNSQNGNNNAYCQDNDISWIDWTLARSADGKQLHKLMRYLIELRETWPLLHWHLFFHNRGEAEYSTRCLWLNASGRPMSASEWQNPGLAAIGMHLLGPVSDADVHREQMLALFNAGDKRHSFSLPKPAEAGRWQRLLDTSREDFATDQDGLVGGSVYPLMAQSVNLFRFIPTEYRDEQ